MEKGGGLDKSEPLGTTFKDSTCLFPAGRRMPPHLASKSWVPTALGLLQGFIWGLEVGRGAEGTQTRVTGGEME